MGLSSTSKRQPDPVKLPSLQLSPHAALVGREGRISFTTLLPNGCLTRYFVSYDKTNSPSSYMPSIFLFRLAFRPQGVFYPRDQFIPAEGF